MAYVNENIREDWEWRTIEVSGHKIRVRVADTLEKRIEGLSGVKRLEEDEGMLFIFENLDFQDFWNKDLLIDLDILWIKNSRVLGVGHLEDVRKSGIHTLSSPDAVEAVLELPFGWAEGNGIGGGELVSGI